MVTFCKCEGYTREKDNPLDSLRQCGMLDLSVIEAF